MKKALVLAGGGARGSYQVGVYQALLEQNWKPDIITGTSVGCLNGAMFVTDSLETVRDMWLHIDTRNVIQKPPRARHNSELWNILQELVSQGAMDVTPLEELIDQLLDEQTIRSSPVRFGLVTVNYSTLTPMQLTLEQIPQGKLKHYLLASAACFPAFRPRTIDGQKYIDGAYSDNMPVQLALSMGAEEIVAVDVDGLGIVRKVPSHVPLHHVHSCWNLGAILTFDPQKARQNMALGYNDCCRTFGKVQGVAYAIQAGAEQQLNERFVRPYSQLLRRVLQNNPSLALAEKAALAPLAWAAKTQWQQALLPLERACQLALVEPEPVYTAESLLDAFLALQPLPEEDRFKALWQPQSGLCVKECAQAAAAPGVFLQSLVAQSVRLAKGDV